MNYLKLNIGGKERGVKLGLLFLENAQKGENMNIQEIFNELQQRSIFFAPKLLNYALLTNCQLNGETPDFNLADVYDWVEEDGISRKDGAVMAFVNAFTENITKLFPPEENEEIKEVGKSKKASAPIDGSKK